MTGVASSIGERVVALLDSDDSVVSIVGLDVSEPVQAARKFEFHLCDLATTDLKSILRGVDVLVQIGASTAIANTSEQVLLRGKDTEETRRLLDAAGGSSVRRVVRVATATVYGAWANNAVPIGEDAPLRPNNGFLPASVDAESERIVLDWSDRHPDATTVVLRVAPVAGPGDFGPFGFASSPTAWERTDRLVQFVHIDDVASAVGLATVSEISGVYNVAANGYLDAREANAIVGGTSGTSKLSSLVKRHGRADVPSAALPYLSHSWVIANDLLRAAGWEPKFSNEEILLLGADTARRQPNMARAASLVVSVLSAAWWIRQKRRSHK